MRSSLVVTHLRCNQACTYCTWRRASDDLPAIQRAAVERRVDAAVAEGAGEIVFTGGEPTLRGDLERLVAHARGRGAAVTLATNATLLDRRRVRSLRAAGLALARVNLAAWGDALDAVTRDPGGFARARAGLDALAAEGVPIELEAAVVRSTAPGLAALPAQARASLGEALRSLSLVVPVESPAPGELLTCDAAATVGAVRDACVRAGVRLELAPGAAPPRRAPEAQARPAASRRHRRGPRACNDAAAVALALEVSEAARAAAAAAAASRPLAYPLGSGQAEELALRAGLKPLVRQLLPPSEVAVARARWERLGLAVVEAPPSLAPAGRGTADRGDRRVVYAARDVAVAREAAAVEARSRHDIALGALLGYPRCCVEAFLEVPPPRRNPQSIQRAWRRTVASGQPPAPRLNVLDLSVFHYLSWFPCSFDCEASRAYADRVAALIGDRVFVARVDAALAAHRLLLLEDVQVSLAGPIDGGAVRIERAWATARDRHPAARLEGPALDGVASLLARLTSAHTVEVVGGEGAGVLRIDGQDVLSTPDVVLVPFGTRGARRGGDP